MSHNVDTSSEATVTSKYYVVLSDSEANNKVIDLTWDHNKIIDLTSDDEEAECEVKINAAVSSLGKGNVFACASHNSAPKMLGDGIGKVDTNLAQGKINMNVDSSKTMKRTLNGFLTNKKKRVEIPDGNNPSYQQCSSQSSASPLKIRRQKLT